jgi:hypothetical protein
VTPETLFTLADARGIQYGHVSHAGRAQWPIEDVALALADMYPRSERDRSFAAYSWRWRKDREQRPMLRFGLLVTTAERAYVEHWPQMISNEPYLERLVDMAILEEHYWFVLRTHQLYASMMQVDEDIWDRRMSRRYESIRHQIERWCSSVHHHMLARMRTDEHERSATCN